MRNRPFFIAASAVWNGLLDLVYPARCTCCGRWMEKSSSWSFCPQCFQMLEFIKEPFCKRCGIALVHESPESLCLRCASEECLPPGLELRSLLRFDGPVQEMLHALKYRRRALRWPDGISAALAELLPQLRKDELLLTSVPLHKNRFNERGFNLPDTIAAALASYTQLKFRCDIIERVRETETQVGKTRSERLLNMSGAFELKRKAPAPELLIVLVDDVITTGATMRAAAEPFLRNGNRVLGISPARAY